MGISTTKNLNSIELTGFQNHPDLGETFGGSLETAWRPNLAGGNSHQVTERQVLGGRLCLWFCIHIIYKCKCIYICQNNADFLSVNGWKYDKYDMTICDSDIPQPDLWAFSSKWLSYMAYQTWHSISLESRGWNTGAFCRLIIRRVFVQVNHGKPIGLLDRVAWAWPH